MTNVRSPAVAVNPEVFFKEWSPSSWPGRVTGISRGDGPGKPQTEDPDVGLCRQRGPRRRSKPSADGREWPQ